MAEIILPPEENEETPQAPELNIDKPTENSKVITIEFEAKKTNKVSTKDTNQQLYTTDTDAWFEFKETSLEGANGTYSVVFRNRHDGSIFQRTGDVVNGVAYYKIPHQEIRHAGAWRGQIVYTLENGNTTAREFGYDVKGHILDGKDVREIVVEDFETLMSQLNSMKDNAELELADLVNTAERNELERQQFYESLVEDINDLQENYKELLDTGVLQTNINEKLEELEEEYAPKLTEVTAQLAQKANDSEVRKSNIKLELEDLSPTTLSAIEGGEGASFNLLSEPQNESVSYEKTTFLEVGKNLFNKENTTQGKRIDSLNVVADNAVYSVTEYIPVIPNTIYYKNESAPICFYDNKKEFIQGQPSTSKFTTPANCFYIRTSFTTAQLDIKQIELGDKETLYEPYRVIFKYQDDIKRKDNIIDINPHAWEQGNLTSAGLPYDGINAIRTSNYIEIKNTLFKVETLNQNFRLRIRLFRDNLVGESVEIEGGYKEGDIIDLSSFTRAKYAKIVIYHTDSLVEIKPSDIEGVYLSNTSLLYVNNKINELSLTSYNVGWWSSGDGLGHTGDMTTFEQEWKSYLNNSNFDLMCMQEFYHWADREKTVDPQTLLFDEIIKSNYYNLGAQINMLSRIPIYDSQIMTVGTTLKRDIVRCKMNLDGEVLTIYGIHLSPSTAVSERQEQINDILNDATSNEHTLIIGDFNCQTIDEYDVLINNQFKLASGGYMGTLPTLRNELPADNIAVSKSIQMKAIHVDIDNTLSDHLPISCVISI